MPAESVPISMQALLINCHPRSTILLQAKNVFPTSFLFLRDLSGMLLHTQAASVQMLRSAYRGN